MKSFLLSIREQRISIAVFVCLFSMFSSVFANGDSLLLPADKVISVYCGSYPSIATNINPPWGQMTVTTELEIDGDTVLEYANLNYQGLDFQQSDVSAMHYLHLEYKTADASSFEFYLITSSVANNGNPYLENSYDIASNLGIVYNEWVSVDIPLSEYTVPNLESVDQFKTVGNGTIYLDNMYFWYDDSLGALPYVLTDDDVTVKDGAITSCSYNFEKTDIVIPDMLDGQLVSSIAYNAFSWRGITSVDLPAYLEELNEDAFRSNAIETINFDRCLNLRLIGKEAFAHNAIDSLYLDGLSLLTEISRAAFSNNGMDTVSFSGCESLTSIGRSAFNKNNLASVDLSPCPYFSSLGEMAFDNNLLTFVTLPISDMEEYNHWIDIYGDEYAGGDSLTDFSIAYMAKVPYTLTDDDVEVTAEGVLQSLNIELPGPFLIIPDTLDGVLVEKIESQASWVGIFSNKDLLEVTLPQGLKEIGHRTFYDNDMAVINIPASVERIAYYAFAYSVDSVVFEDGSMLREIGEEAFYGNAISEITLPIGVESIGPRAFQSCDLDTLVFPVGGALKSIGESAFMNNYITAVKLPNSVISVGAYAFSSQYVPDFNSFVLPVPQEPGFEAWLDMYGQVYAAGDTVRDLSSAYFAKIPYTLTDDDVEVDEEGDLLACSYDFTSKFITIPDTLDGVEVRVIGYDQEWSGVFRDKGIMEITLPQGLIEISDYEFYDNNISQLTIPANVNYIGNSAFNNCGIDTVIFEAGCQLSMIGEYSFYNNQFSTIFIPQSVVEIGHSAFGSCGSDTLIIEPGSQLNKIAYSAFNGHNFSTVDLPNSVILIESGAFNPDWGNGAFTEFILPEPQLSTFEYWLDDNAEVYAAGDTVSEFYTTYFAKIPYQLTDEDVEIDEEGNLSVCYYDYESRYIIIPEMLQGQTVRSIADDNWKGVFQYAGLYEVRLPSTLEYIGDNTFQNNLLMSVVIPSSVHYIGSNAFYDNAIAELVFEDESALTEIANSAFGNNTISELFIPNSVVSIGDYAFSANYSDTIIFESGSHLMTIGNNAFNGHSFSRVDLPSSVISIAYGAFYGSYYSPMVLITLPDLQYESFEYWYDYQGNIYNVGDTIMNVWEDYKAKVPYTLTDEDVEVVDGFIEACDFSFGFTDVIIPDTLDGQAVIGVHDNVFEGQQLSSLQLPSTIEYIGHHAFASNALQSIDFSHCASLMFIDQGAFSYNSFSSFYLPELELEGFLGWEDSYGLRLETEQEVFFNNYRSYQARFPYVLTNADVVVIEGVVTELKGDFPSDVLVMPNVLDAQEVIGIDDYVFAYRDLAGITLPEGLLWIGEEAFRGCALDSIMLPADLLYIGLNAFAENSIPAIVLPEMLTEGFVDWVASDGNGNSTSGVDTLYNVAQECVARMVSYTLTGDDVVVEDGVITHYDFDFKVKALTIPSAIDGDTIIGISVNVFMGEQIAELILPSTLQIIGNGAFEGNDLSLLTLPAAVSSIGKYAFSDNPKLDSVVFAEGTKLSSLGVMAFGNTALSTLTLPVPDIAGFVTWEDADGNLYAGGVETENLYVSYVAKSSFFYTLTDDDVTMENGYIMSCNYDFENKNIIIPEVLDGEAVIGIAHDNSHGIFEKTGIVELVLPVGIKDVGSRAFAYNAIGHVAIPDGVERIAYGAFAMNNLDSISVPASVEVLGYYAFYSNPIDTIGLPYNSELYYIGDGAMGYREFVLPENQEAGFDGWESNQQRYEAGDVVNDYEVIKARIAHTLTAEEVRMVGDVLVGVDLHPKYNLLTIPADLGVTSIDDKDNGEGVFQDLGLRELTLPAGLRSIGYYAFADNNLDTLILPEGIEKIGAYAFSACGLNDLSLPDGVVFIGSAAFDNNNFWQFVLPNVGAEGFLGWISDYGVYEVGDWASTGGTYWARYPYTLTDDDVVVIDNEIVSCSYSFIQRDIIIPNILDGQQIYGIADNYSGQGVFAEKGLLSLQLPENLVAIGAYAFSNNHDLEALNLPVSVEMITYYAFQNCGLQALNIPDGSHLSMIDVGAFESNSRLDSVFIGANVTTIGNNAFRNCGINKLVFEEGSQLMTIKSQAFANSGNLNVVELPASVATIEYEAFYNCGVNYLTFEDGSQLTAIPERAFAYNYALGSVSIPPLVTYIGESAFYDCNINTLDFEGNNVLELIEYNAFSQNNIDTLVVPASVVSIGGQAFHYSGVEYLVFEDSSRLLSIGNSAFYGNYSLFNVVLPDSVMKIETNAFANTGISGFELPSLYNWLDDYGNAYSGAAVVNDIWNGYIAAVLVNVDTVYTDSSMFYDAGGEFENYEPGQDFTVTYYPVTEGNILVFDFEEFYIGEDEMTIYDGTSTGAPNLGSYRYSWLSGQVSASNDEGALTFSLKSNNSYAMMGWKAEVRSVPFIIDFYANNTQSSHLPFDVQFYSYLVATDAPVYSWDFDGDGVEDSDEEAPSFSYEQDGLYTVSLTVIDGGDTLTSIYEDYVQIVSPYTLTDDDVEVVDGKIVACSYDFLSKEITIPNVLDGQVITGIANSVFNSQAITSIVLPDSLLSIGDYAFAWNQIGDLDLPANLQYLGYAAFGSNAMSYIELPTPERADGAIFLQWDGSYGNSYNGGEYVHSFWEKYVATFNTYSISITVYADSEVLPGATVTIADSVFVTDTNGVATLSGIQRLYDDYYYTVEKEGYRRQSGNLYLSGDIAFEVWTNAVYNITITVTDGVNPIPFVDLIAGGSHFVTDENGVFYYENIGAGVYNYSTSVQGYLGTSGNFAIVDKDEVLEVQLNPVPEPVYSVMFTILDDGDNALHDAVLSIGGETFNSDWEGAVDLYNVPSGVYPYTVVKSGYESVMDTITVVDAALMVEVNLPEILTTVYSATLYVRDNNYNRVANAEVVIGSMVYYTDDNGELLIPNLTNGLTSYTISKDGYNSLGGNIEITGYDRYVDVTLTEVYKPWFLVDFTVNDANGAVGDVKVEIENNMTWTDTLGSAWFNLQAGDYTYELTKVGYETTSGILSVVDDDISINVSLVEITDPVYTLSFNVNDGTDPISNAMISMGDANYYTDWFGGLTLINMTDGDYSYTVSAQGYDELSSIVSISGTDANENIVLNATEDPVYAIELWFNIQALTITFDGEVYEVSDSYVHIFNLAPGTYDYVCTAVGYQEQSGQLTILNTGLNMYISLSEVLIPTYTVNINVAEGESAIAGATVSLGGESYITGENGVATFGGLIAGTYDYTVVAQGYTIVSSSVVVTEANVSEQVALIAISEPVYTLTLKVVDGGDYYIDATVSVGDVTQMTNVLGEAAFYNLEAGGYVYSITAQGYMDTSAMFVISSDTIISVELQERATPVYTLKLTLRDGLTPVVGAEVILGAGLDTLMSDANGVVEFTNLEAATYTISVSADGYDAITAKMIDVNRDVNQQVDMQLSTYDVSFTVTDGTHPIAGANVTLGQYGSLVSAADGVVTFTDVLPTAEILYSVQADTYDALMDLALVVDGHVQVPVVMQLSTYEVSFTVTDGTSPIAGATVTLGEYASAVSNTMGLVNITGVLPAASIAYSVVANGYDTYTSTLAVVDQDVMQAVDLSLTTYDVSLIISDGTLAIEGASVTLGSYGTFTSGVNGNVTFNNVVPTASLLYSVQADGYEPISEVSIEVDGNEIVNVTLTLLVYNVTFTVSDGVDAIEGASVAFGDQTAILTDAQGQAIFTDVVPANNIAYQITADGFETAVGSVSVIDSNVTEAVALVATTGLSQNAYLNVVLYPNPAQEYVVVSTDKLYALKLYDVSGNLLLNERMHETSTKLDLSGFNSGMYLLQFVDDDKVFIKRVFIE